MIKLSRLTDYAVVVLAAMVSRDDNLASASSLSAETGLPEPTVCKVLKLLARGGTISSSRGVNGGYALKNSPEDILISDVIAAIEGPIALTACVDGSQDCCAVEKMCMLRGRWGIVNAAIQSALDNVTLADMLRPQDRRIAASVIEKDAHL